MLSIRGSTTFKISISLSKIMLCFTSLHFAFLIFTFPDSGRNLHWHGKTLRSICLRGLLSMGDITQLHRCPLADLAYKKSTAQSSTDSNGFSSRAVDENVGPYYSSKSCTHTKKETNPWWRVDLGREYIVTGSLWIESHGFSKIERSWHLCSRAQAVVEKQKNAGLNKTKPKTANVHDKLLHHWPSAETSQRRIWFFPMRSQSMKIVVVPQIFACIY